MSTPDTGDQDEVTHLFSNVQQCRAFTLYTAGSVLWTTYAFSVKRSADE